MTKAEQQIPIEPIEAVMPSPTVAEATIRIVSDLVALRDREGREACQVEAMAMHNASIAVLRPAIGVEGVFRMLSYAVAENERVDERDQVSADIGKKRAARGARSARP